MPFPWAQGAEHAEGQRTPTSESFRERAHSESLILFSLDRRRCRNDCEPLAGDLAFGGLARRNGYARRFNIAFMLVSRGLAAMYHCGDTADGRQSSAISVP